MVLAAGCTTAESPSIVVDATEEASATPTPADEATPAEEEPVACEPGVLCDGPLEAGTYTTDLVGATTLSLELDGGWIGQMLPAADAIALYPDDSDVNGFYVFRYTGEVFADPCDIESATEVEADPQAIIDWVNEHPELVGGGATPHEMGDATGSYVYVEAEKAEDCSDVPPEWVLLFVLPDVGDFHLEEGSQAMIGAFTVGEETVVVVAESLENHDEFTLRARVVFASMELTGS